MFYHYIRIAWRNLHRNKSFSLINIGGLAIGMTVALVIGLWMHSEFQFDKSFKNYDKIVQVMRQDTIEGQIEVESAIPIPISSFFKNKYNQYFQHIVIASWFEDHILSNHHKPLAFNGIYMDKGAGDMLSLHMVYGNYQAFSDPNSILISNSVSKAFFGNNNPIGQNLTIDNEFPVKVVGVYKDFNRNSSFSGQDFIAPWRLYVASNPWVKKDYDQWGNNSFQFFAQLAPNQTVDHVNQIIQNGLKREDIQNLKEDQSTFRLLPMRDWHLRNQFKNGKQTGGLISQVRLFGVIGIMVLLIACINFMNLSTARSEKRAKEVGIRKAIGSLRGQLMRQFYFESLLVSLIAFVIAMITVWLGLPWFNNLYQTNVTIPWSSPLFWAVLVVFILITNLIAGSYPALYLSSVGAIKALKGKFKAGTNAVTSRKVLIVGQFTLSLVLIIATAVVYQQIKFAENRNLGYDKDQLIDIRMKSKDFYGKYDLIRNELISNQSIKDMAESSSPMTQIWTYNDAFFWEGKDPALKQSYGTIWVTADYGNTIGWHIKNGRDFSKNRIADSTSIILNEAAVQYMGLKDPIDKRIRWGAGKEAKNYEVIGVVQDMIMQSPNSPSLQTIYFMDPEQANWITIRLNAAAGINNALSKVQATFKKYIPDAPFDYSFVSKQYADKFASENRVATLAGLFSFMAIFICSIGLFGLASFMAEQRIKEIGIRKVLGASVTQLWIMLSKSFLYLVLVSSIIAIPVGWYVMHLWLRRYTFRTPITGWLLIAPAIIALVVTLLTVSWQAIKAAKVNPVESLKTE
ncbi:ABC transporter permease [Arachidicoccus ginsenosidivorans]|uniref:FtsX-like permease family protein n=1 Tax=Arachidicoccus ginsenosidivorans TaxID=496057 RepID=A0A5B8VHH0_9BACT|nr:FtsX-like permease family protein [Arachidicoccus ginsenosidivorans]QEC70920.1 FtsX-like permease family protein [Arachidicoccus ginsenosidivorans]